MKTFGKKLRDIREGKSFSQSELARILETNHSIIGKYERDEVKPTIDVVRRLATALDTSVAFLLDEDENSTEVFKDVAMVKRLKDIVSFSSQEREHILYTLDALIWNAKTKQSFAL
jgi:transcriptional regulator with XRE-family HTH domain